MMKAAAVSLCPRISVADANILSEWLKDELVTRYLNESASVSSDIRELAETLPPYLLTARFNSDGRFYMIRDAQPDDDPDDGSDADAEPIGFVKLSDAPGGYEIVFAIGETSRWGEGIGSAAVSQALSKAFFDCRAPKVVAKIAPGNVRSERLVSSLGFIREGISGKCAKYELTMRRYLDCI